MTGPGRSSSGPGPATSDATSRADESSLRVTEIFRSIQGESTWAGLPCTFIRLTGCPLRCVWCDTAYAFHGGRRMTLDEILEAVDTLGGDLVEITGGEPLVQRETPRLGHLLLERGSRVLLETSGALDVAHVDQRIHKIMDIKCPGSGEADRNLWSNLEHLTSRDEVKFVVAGLEDFAWAVEVVKDRGLDLRMREGEIGALLVSPVWESVDLPALSDAVLASDVPFRLQTQLHKLVWGAEARGV